MQVGAVVGNYRITGKLGAGEMGVVYVAKHARTGREAAVKMLPASVSGNEAVITRVFQEAKTTTAVGHPGIVEVLDFGYAADGRAYLVMERLGGESLGSRLRRVGRLPLEQALSIARHVSGALYAAHRIGVVHRDLKPDNIHLVPDPDVPGGERAKVLNFGIAMLRDKGGFSSHETPGDAPGTVMGEPMYMSPEQCTGAERVDHRTDLYALGCILFEMLCGQPPFDGKSYGVVLAQQVRQIPPAPSSIEASLLLRPEVDDFVLKLLEKDPERRFQDAFEVLTRVHGLCGTSAPVAPPLGPIPTPSELAEAMQAPPSPTMSGVMSSARRSLALGTRRRPGPNASGHVAPGESGESGSDWSSPLSGLPTVSAAGTGRGPVPTSGLPAEGAEPDETTSETTSERPPVDFPPAQPDQVVPLGAMRLRDPRDRASWPAPRPAAPYTPQPMAAASQRQTTRPAKPGAMTVSPSPGDSGSRSRGVPPGRVPPGPPAPAGSRPRPAGGPHGPLPPQGSSSPRPMGGMPTGSPFPPGPLPPAQSGSSGGRPLPPGPLPPHGSPSSPVLLGPRAAALSPADAITLQQEPISGSMMRGGDALQYGVMVPQRGPGASRAMAIGVVITFMLIAGGLAAYFIATSKSAMDENEVAKLLRGVTTGKPPVPEAFAADQAATRTGAPEASATRTSKTSAGTNVEEKKPPAELAKRPASESFASPAAAAALPPRPDRNQALAGDAARTPASASFGSPAAALPSRPERNQAPAADDARTPRVEPPAEMPVKDPETRRRPIMLITLQIDTLPPGAVVFRRSDGVRLGETPFTYQTEPQSSPITIVLRHKGYRDEVVVLPGNRSAERRVPLTRSDGPGRAPSLKD